MHTFDITIQGNEYEIEIVEDGEEVEIFIERIGVADDDEDIPENELLMVTEYLIREGFVKDPEAEEDK